MAKSRLIGEHDDVPAEKGQWVTLSHRDETIGAVLRSAGMTYSDIVRINAFVTGREHLAGYMAARDEFVETPPPASTLMIVSGFARPEFKVEVEVMAPPAPP